ncbi:MAG: DUF748 domain-containing protein [Cyclobacteriaceae bacterium]
MNTDTNTPKKKWSVFKIIILSSFVFLVIAGVLLYNNLNRLLSESLLKSFNSTVVSDVYELKFENLRVNVFEGTIRVFSVVLQPREKPLRVYPYINSSFRLTTEKLTLKNVEIFTLLESKELNLERISITKPEIELMLTGKRNIMLPFKDTTATVSQPKAEKKSLGSFKLNEFQLIDAAFHVINEGKQREFKVKDFNISMYDLVINQDPGKYGTSFNQVALSIGELSWDLEKGPLKHVGFKDFKVGVDSLALEFTLDTMIYRFHDFNTGLHDLDIQTKDSLFHVAVKSFDLSYKDKSIKLKGVSFKPNVSHAVLQRKHQYQNTEFSGSVGKLEVKDVNFDSLIYAKKLFIDEIKLDNVKATIFKDKTKPIDSARRPVYLGQTVRAISLPLLIKHVKATDVELENTERKPDSAYAKVNITKATLEVKNITNLSTRDGLQMKADAHINGKAHFKVALTFSYQKPQFNFEGEVKKFDLPDLNTLIQAYTPAQINKGVSDEISFVGLAEQTRATGTMKFLYHDLEIDLLLKEQAKWKSAVIAFAANTVLNSSNPVSSDSPPREVKFSIQRDMTKGFINVLIKSILNGLKETMIMSKENREIHKASKKQSKKDNKK